MLFGGITKKEFVYNYILVSTHTKGTYFWEKHKGEPINRLIITL